MESGGGVGWLVGWLIGGKGPWMDHSVRVCRETHKTGAAAAAAEIARWMDGCEPMTRLRTRGSLASHPIKRVIPETDLALHPQQLSLSLCVSVRVYVLLSSPGTLSKSATKLSLCVRLDWTCVNECLCNTNIPTPLNGLIPNPSARLVALSCLFINK